ncbi:MAG: hypothetical protein H7Y20_12660, partial [Bryobacteraceae bacterium]|nr:hypothetical protein [Bryobacteraceae bacterium]
MAILKSALARFRDLRPAFVETVLFLAAAVAIDTIFLDGSRYSAFSQHPFWAIVLLTTVQYGTRAGLLATCLASFALLAGNLPPHTLTQDGFAWMAQVTTLPLLWFLASVVLGELRVRQIRVSEDLREKLTSSQEREHVLTEAYQRISSVRQTLEARVAGQLHTSVSIHEAARGIEKLDASEVLLGIPGLIKAVINPKQFSVFLIRKDALEISLREGWTDDSVYPVRYGSDSELFREVIGSCR